MKKLKVAIDVLPLATGHETRGVGTYLDSLLREFKESDDIELIKFEKLKEVVNAAVCHFPFFSLYNHDLPISKKFPTVVTIHDLIPIIFKDKYPFGTRARVNFLLQKIALRSCKAVIVNSESTKRDVIKYLKVAPKKIHVTYLAQKEIFKVVRDVKALNETKKKYNLPDEFALFVGDINWNKNLYNLSKACIETGIDLVLVGKGFETKENLNHKELESYRAFLELVKGNSKIHILGYVKNNELVNIYNLAKVLLLPSFYEGFGFPILEAQACGTPVITSNTSSMPEIAGNGAIFVDPNSSMDISRKIISILTNKKLEDDLISEGFLNARKFSWQKCANETIKVYQSIASSK